MMRGLLKSRPPVTQLLLLISLALVSFFMLGLLGTFLLAYLTGTPVTQLADISKWNLKDPGTITFIRGMQVIQFVSLFLIPVLTCAWLFSTNTKTYLGLKRPRNYGYYVAGIGVMLLAIPMVNWLGELNRSVEFPGAIGDWMNAKEEEAARTIEALLSQRSIKDLLLNLVFIAVLAAVGEELLFRGVLQRLLTKMFRNPIIAVILTAFLFSAMHMQFYGFLPRFALGIVLGLMYWYSGSLWTAIIAHFVYDATLIILAYMNPELITSERAVELKYLALSGVISFGLVVMIVAWMKKKSTAVFPDAYAEDYIPVKDHPF